MQVQVQIPTILKHAAHNTENLFRDDDERFIFELREGDRIIAFTKPHVKAATVEAVVGTRVNFKSENGRKEGFDVINTAGMFSKVKLEK